MRQPFEILSLNISERKGEQKKPIGRITLREDHGIEGDAHAGNWHRQVSLLASEDIETMRGRGIEIGYGDFAENITTRGLPLSELPVGARLLLGECILVVTQIGKRCHHGCAVYRAVGDCVMPRRGVFARVLRGGEVSCDSDCYYNL